MSIKLKLIKFYERKEIIEEILRICENREFAYMYENKVFGKRPLVLENERDIIEYVKRGAISFHISEERWSNPLLLSPSLKRRELEELRIGWDLIIDIDSKDLKLSKIVALRIIDLLKEYGIRNFSIKFSGNKGFHIGIPWESFPKEIDGTPTKNMFPELPRTISSFILSKIYKKVEKDILREIGDEEEIKRIYNLEEFDVLKIISIDTILISSRHLFRMPFSLNEKTLLLSIPLDPNEIKYFSKEEAEIDNYEFNDIRFLEPSDKEEAERLVYSALAWEESEKLEKDRMEKKTIEFREKEIEKEIEEEMDKSKNIIVKIKKFGTEYFPPCIKNILEGLEDGRKRSVFILINFLKRMGWKWDEIKETLEEWNEKNKEPLRERYIEYQIEWHKRKYKEGVRYLPPNCLNKDYYIDIGVCQKDEICLNIKNPIQYPLIKYKMEKSKKE